MIKSGFILLLVLLLYLGKSHLKLKNKHKKAKICLPTACGSPTLRTTASATSSSTQHQEAVSRVRGPREACFRIPLVWSLSRNYLQEDNTEKMQPQEREGFWRHGLTLGDLRL